MLFKYKIENVSHQGQEMFCFNIIFYFILTSTDLEFNSLGKAAKSTSSFIHLMLSTPTGERVTQEPGDNHALKGLFSSPYTLMYLPILSVEFPVTLHMEPSLLWVMLVPEFPFHGKIHYFNFFLKENNFGL